MKIGELFMALGFRVDDDNLKTFNNEISALKKKLLSLPMIIGATAYAIDKFTASSVNGAVAVQNFVHQTGLLGSELQKYQIAGQLSDIALSSEQVTGSIQNLQGQLAQIRLGGGNIQPFMLAGVDVMGKNAFQVIEELRNAFKQGRLGDRTTASNLLDQMGLGREFIRIIELSKNEFEALGNQFVRSPKLVKSLEDMGTAITKFKMALSFLKDTFNGLISEGVTSFFTFLTGATSLFTNLVMGIDALIDRFAILGQAIKAFALVGVGLYAVFNPIKTLLIGLLLLIEDFVVYTQGGKSITGKLFNSFKEVGNEISNFFKGILEALMRLINEPIEKLKAFTAKLKNFFTFDYFSNDKLTSGIAKGKETTNNNVIQTTINILAETAEDVIDAIGRAGNMVSDKIAITYDEITAGDAR